MALAFCLWLLFCLWPVSALACGSLDQWVARYWQGQREKALTSLALCARGYAAPGHDAALLKLVSDALAQGPLYRMLAAEVFHRYNCLWGARQRPGYKITATVLGAGCRAGRFQGWLVVIPAQGANLRAGPSLKAGRMLALRRGMQVEKLGRKGDWLRVAPVGPEAQGRYKACGPGWMHASLLAPY